MKNLIVLVAVCAALYRPMICPSIAQQVSGSRVENQRTGFEAVEIHFDTDDRSFRPMRIETRLTDLGAGRSRQESIVQIPRASGLLFDAERTTTVTEQLGQGKTRRSTEMVETDRQGRSRLVREISEEINESSSGKQTSQLQLQRTTSGDMRPQHEITTVETTHPDGRITRHSEKRMFDVNNQPVLTQQSEETIVSATPAKTVSELSVHAIDHMSGKLHESAREQTITIQQGNRIATERLIMTPLGTGGWATTVRVVSTETTGSDGTLQRETIKYEQPDHGKAMGRAWRGKLKPSLKIVEKAVSGTVDGVVSLQREVFVRDVNDRWVPQTFSSKLPGRGAYERRE